VRRGRRPDDRQRRPGPRIRPAQHQTLNHLRLEGCNLVQGYVISKPLPADEFADWLAARVPLLGQA
jgi:hypothetical protein